MKKKEIEKEKKEQTFTPITEPFFGDSAWLMGLIVLGLLSTPKSESKTVINIYTGSDK